nr:MAG TPA: ParB protein [Caudoviricetes sp.]
MEIVYKKINELIPYINNARTHDEEQIDQICASINEYGWTNPVLIDEKGMIIAGHGRVEAGKKLDIKEVPCIVLSGLTEAQKKAYIIADNKMALNAGWDEDLLKLELDNLKELDFDLELTGFSTEELDEFFKEDEEENETLQDNPYTIKTDIPHYEIKGEEPLLEELIDEEKTNKLIEKINQSNISEENKHFLIKSAQRHLTFNYSKIAEFYAHQDKEMQELMEDSALVLIDYKDAIKNGYVKLSKNLEEIFEECE